MMPRPPDPGSLRLMGSDLHHLHAILIVLSVLLFVSLYWASQ